MSWKTKVVVAMTVASSWFGVSSAQAKEKTDNIKTNKTEVRRAPMTNPDTATYPLQPEAANDPQVMPNLHKNQTVMDTTENVVQEDTLVNDSIISACKRTNLEKAEQLMLYLIAHFEGFKSKAYWDPAGKVWTIGLGNTVKPDGTPVRSGDVIRTEEEAVAYCKQHVQKNMAEDMIDYLPLDKMSMEEIAIMGSLLYNTGSGKLRRKDRSPSDLSRTATEYFVKRDPASAEAFKQQYLALCKDKHGVNKTLVDRRNSEWSFLSNQIKITIDEPTNTDKNIINLRTTFLGSLYGCVGDNDKIMSRFDQNSSYTCPIDSLSYAIQKDLQRAQTVRRAGTAPKQQKLNVAQQRKRNTRGR